MNTTNNEVNIELKKQREKTFKIFVPMAAAIIIVLFVMKFIAMNGRIPSNSMEPTLYVGEYVIVNRMYKEVERGDIISFRHNGEFMIKRIIGLPGEKISFEDGKVYVNDALLDESEYLSDDVETVSDSSFEVPKGEYFVLGDNRGDSFDSREWEYSYLSEDEIVGFVSYKYSLNPKKGLYIKKTK